jgi:hypothetical protein
MGSKADFELSPKTLGMELMQYISARNRDEYEEKREAILEASKVEVEAIFRDFAERSSSSRAEIPGGSIVERSFYESVKRQSTQIARACLTPGVSGKERLSKTLEGMLLSLKSLSNAKGQDPREELLVHEFENSIPFLEKSLYEQLRQARQTQTKLIQRTNRVRAVLARQSVHTGDANGLTHRRVSNMNELRHWVDESFDYFYKKTLEDKTIAKQLLGNYQAEWQLFTANLFPALRTSLKENRSPEEFESKFTAFLSQALTANNLDEAWTIKKEAKRNGDSKQSIRDDITLSNGLIINVVQNLRNSMRSRTGRDSITLIFTLPVEYLERLPQLRRHLTTAMQGLKQFESVEMEIGTDLRDPSLPAILIDIPKTSDDAWLEKFESAVIEVLARAMG